MIVLKFEPIFFWVTLFIYVGAFCFHLIGFITGKTKWVDRMIFILWGGLGVHTITGIIHWSNSGHPPVTDTYELNLTGIWFTILIYLLFVYWGKVEKTIGLAVIPISFLLLGYGYLSGIRVNPMGPAFQSPWLVVHVIFAWLAFGFYAMATGTALFLWLKLKNPDSARLQRLPTPEDLDINSYRFIVLGFINHAVMLISGAIWAKRLWGHFWSWDPLETWSLIAFLYYAFYLHVRSFLGWKMNRAAWLALLGLVVLAISYWGVEWFGPTLHPGP